MKRIFTALLVLSMLMSLGSCAKDDTRVPDFSYVSDQVDASASDDTSSEASDVEENAGSSEDVATDSSDEKAASADSEDESNQGTNDDSKGEGQGLVSLANDAYTVYIIKGENNSYTVKALVPKNITSGKIVVSVNEKLELKAGSLKTVEGNAQKNEKYNRDGIKGACAVFAFVNALPENTVVFEAEYTASSLVTAADFSVNLWNLVEDKTYVGSQDTGNVVKKYIG